MGLFNLKEEDGLIEVSDNIPKDKERILWRCRIEFDYAERDKNLFALKDERFLDIVEKDFVEFYILVNGNIKKATKIAKKYLKKLSGVKKIYLGQY